MSEKLTPVQFSAIKRITGTKNGKSYDFKSVGFTTREHGGSKWFNFAFNDENPLKEGQSVELDISERHYKDKNGAMKVAYDAKKPNAMVDFAKTLMKLSVKMGELEKRVEMLERKPDNIPIIHEEASMDFDESGAPIPTEPDLSDVSFS